MIRKQGYYLQNASDHCDRLSCWINLILFLKVVFYYCKFDSSINEEWAIWILSPVILLDLQTVLEYFIKHKYRNSFFPNLIKFIKSLLNYFVTWEYDCLSYIERIQTKKTVMSMVKLSGCKQLWSEAFYKKAQDGCNINNTNLVVDWKEPYCLLGNGMTLAVMVNTIGCMLDR